MKNLFHHFFLPQESNNHRAKILHHNSLFTTILFLLLSTTLVLPWVKTSYPQVLGISINISAIKLLELTNQKRVAQGLEPLVLNEQLSKAAEEKAQYMFTKNFWAHTAPDGTTPWVFIKKSGYTYVYAGENLARGFTQSTDVVNAWMASTTHRENMLSGNYKDIGFAVESGILNGETTVLVVEMFGNKTLATAPQKNLKNPTANIPVQKTEHAQVPVQKTFGIAINKEPLISSLFLSKGIGLILLLFFLGILTLDMVIIERKKIVRLVGHNLDHVFFLGSITVLLIIIGYGVIL